MKTKIVISGAGGTIHHEIYSISDFLKSKGYEVKVIDDSPPKDIKEYGFDSYGNPVKCEIEIKANHLPWGG